MTPIHLDRILELEDKNDAICRVMDYLLTKLPKNFVFNQFQQTFNNITNLEGEIANGGFNQFFFNSSGNFAHETVSDLEIIGAFKTSQILQEAINQFPNSIVPKNRQERIEILEQIEEVADEVWDKLDEKFGDYEEDLTSLLMEYVKKNREYFITKTPTGEIIQNSLL